MHRGIFEGKEAAALHPPGLLFPRRRESIQIINDKKMSKPAGGFRLIFFFYKLLLESEFDGALVAGLETFAAGGAVRGGFGGLVDQPSHGRAG